MNLQENILRIREMMGLINENIDDILDKMNRGEQLSQQEKDKMVAYSNHLNSGGVESDFDYEEKEPEMDENLVFKIDEWERLDLNTPIEQVWKIFDDIYKGMKIAEGLEKWRPWDTSLNKVANKEDQPNEQLIKCRIAFWTSKEGFAIPEIIIQENIDTGDKEVKVIEKFISVDKEKYKDSISDPYNTQKFYIFFDKNNQGGTPEAVEFGQRAMRSWVEKTFGLPENTYEFTFINSSDRFFKLLKDIKDNIIGEI